MVTALLEGNKKDCILIGLNQNDLDALKRQDFKIDLSQFGVIGYKLFIVHGETDSAIKTELLRLASNNDIPTIEIDEAELSDLLKRKRKYNE